MAVCKKCKKEYTSLQEVQKYCPACKHPEKEVRSPDVQDRHLQEKQKRQTSE